tara:strand:+ start:411 stop:578 length:168 start_codon:yes stop_codon:yes gene_type:complete
MRHDETRDNTTAIEANLSEADAREDTENTEPEEFQNHVGDGPSGFDHWQDTKWCC